MQPLKTQAQQLGRDPSAPDISTLAKRFAEPLRGEEPIAPRPVAAKPTPVPHAPGLPETQELAAYEISLPAAVRAKPWLHLNRKAAISAAALSALLPLALLALWLWQDTPAERTAEGAAPAVEGTAQAASPEPAQRQTSLEVALTSPERIEADTGATVGFPIVIDATAALPARSIVAVTALPEGAAFSEGRPYGAGGWSFHPDETGDVHLRLPAQSSVSDIRLELIAGDGTVLAQSETQLSVTPAPVAAAPVAAITPELATAAPEPLSESDEVIETTGSIASVPAPARKANTAAAESDLKVNKVKAVTIPAPRASRPHDGAYALAPPQDEPQTGGEWMVTKTAVDMHAKALQSSETVKVAEKGVKLRVTARDKNWIQVHDPKSSTTGWIYNRFLTPADPPAQ